MMDSNPMQYHHFFSSNDPNSASNKKINKVYPIVLVDGRTTLSSMANKGERFSPTHTGAELSLALEGPQPQAKGWSQKNKIK
jgi:hypothetical protein